MADTSQPHSSRCPAWLREGGLYLIVSGVVTVLKYVLLLFLPRALPFCQCATSAGPASK